MTSMTGYAYNMIANQKAIVSVEIKSVNARFLDLTINLPPYLNVLESYFRSKIIDKIYRGKVDVFIRVKELESDSQIIADTNAAKQYLNAIQSIAKEIGYSTEIPLELIINQDGVLTTNKNYDTDYYKELITPVFDKTLQDFMAERTREGENLKKDLLSKLEKLLECANFFTEFRSKMDAYFKDLLVTKFTELVGQSVDENRIMTEVAAMIVKYTINEEVVRLNSHLAAMKTEILDNPFPGKKLDFLCQEANREINTIGSKNQFAELGAMVVNAKDCLENIREQSKNVE